MTLDPYDLHNIPDYKGVEVPGMPKSLITGTRTYRENEAILNPLPGDHWDDNSTTLFNLFILKVLPRLVWIASATGDFESSFTVEVFNRDQFNAFMRFGGQHAYTGMSPWRPSPDIFDTPNRARFCLQERSTKVDGWLDFAISKGRPYTEHTHV